MKIQFVKQHTDAFGKTYLPGWVADWSEPDAERAIAEGFAVLAPEGAYPRKTAAPSFDCAAPPSPPNGGEMFVGELEKTGEKIELDDLPESAKKQARRVEGGFFKKK